MEENEKQYIAPSFEGSNVDCLITNNTQHHKKGYNNIDT